MYIKILAAATVGAAMVVGAGCTSTPKVTRVVPVYVVTTNAVTTPSPYRFSEEPAKRLLADEGKEYRAHARELQRMRLAHERALVGIEQAAEEARLAKERGVSLQPPPAPQPAAPVPAPRQNGGATFGVLPNGAPVLLPSQPLVPVVPSGYYQYEERPNYGVLHNGAPILLPSSMPMVPVVPSGGYYQYQERAPYGTLPNGAPVLLPSGGGGGYGGGYGYTPIAPGTFRSAVRANWGPVRSGPLRKFEAWLSQSQSGPGYRHTGGPATITRTYGASAEVAAGGGFTSGLAVRGGWGR